MTTSSSVETRLERLEHAVAALSAELAELRRQLPAREAAAGARETGAPAVRTPPVSPRRPAPAANGAPRRRPRLADRLDFERLVGRYGMLGIAVLAAVAAVGTFLSWAISRGYITLGPAARVTLGLVFAGGLGAWGMQLRRRERSFGSSIVGLALVIVLVCAYAAGPGFALVPTGMAFVGSAAVAWVLAVFARREDDEPLWCVAFGGAAVAPFVTSNGTGSEYALVAYGVVLLLFACFAISHREWPVAWRVFYLAAALFVVASAASASPNGTPGFLTALALPLVVGAVGVLPFAPDTRKRAALRWLALLALLASLAAHAPSVFDAWVISVGIFVAAALWLTIVDRMSGVAQSSILASTAGRSGLLDWLDVAAIPLLLSARASDVLPPGESASIFYGAAAILLLAFAWRRAAGSARDAAAGGLMMAAFAALMKAPLETPTGRVAALLVLSMAALMLHRMRPSLSWVAAGAIVLVAAAGLSVEALTGRAVYRIRPFLTEASFTAACVTVALIIVARTWRWLFDATRAAMTGRPEWTHAGGLRSMLRAVTAAPWVWAFVWGLIELSMAYSPSTSTLLLVAYFAATAVACVAVGRARRAARVRQAGLALGLAAAATSVYGASTYFGIGARIAAYLVTSAFLLGIAYWYRRPGTAALS